MVPKYIFVIQFCWQEKTISERLKAREELLKQQQAGTDAAGGEQAAGAAASPSQDAASPASGSPAAPPAAGAPAVPGSGLTAPADSAANAGTPPAPAPAAAAPGAAPTSSDHAGGFAAGGYSAGGSDTDQYPDRLIAGAARHTRNIAVDQVKKLTDILFKYRFWLICGVITLLPVGGWFKTTSQLKTEFETRKTAIKSKIDAMKLIQGTANHPNPFAEAGISEFITELSSDVAGAWAAKYRRQEQILVWPPELGEDFISRVETFKPFESLSYPTDPKQELVRVYRERYRDYIREELPKLAAIAGARWRAPQFSGSNPMGGGGSGGYGGETGGMGYGMGGMGGMGAGYGTGGMGAGYGMPGGGMTGPGMRRPGANDSEKELVKEEIVRWDPQDQARLQNMRFDWSNNPDKAPKTLDILYSQEDLWVLNALMQIVARTNRGATAQYNATIKQINYIDLGKFVGRNLTRVTRVQSHGGRNVGGGGRHGKHDG